MRFVLVVAAIVAALVEHHFTEVLSRLGLFGSAYGSYAHVAMWPTVALGLVMLVTLFAAAYRELATKLATSDWVVELARKAARLSPVNAFLTIFGLQLAALFGMESVEQFIAFGHLEGGTSWLGAPVSAAIALAVFVAFAIATCLRVGLSAVIAAARAIVSVYAELAILVAPRARFGTFLRIATVARVTPVPVLASRSGLRAPPLAL